MIELRLFATLREGREKIMLLDPETYSSSRIIIDELEIPEEEISILLINGRHSKLDAPLNDGDIVSLFPPVGGG